MQTYYEVNQILHNPSGRTFQMACGRPCQTLDEIKNELKERREKYPDAELVVAEWSKKIITV